MNVCSGAGINPAARWFHRTRCNEKESGTFYRNGPQRASHKLYLLPSHHIQRDTSFGPCDITYQGGRQPATRPESALFRPDAGGDFCGFGRDAMGGLSALAVRTSVEEQGRTSRPWHAEQRESRSAGILGQRASAGAPQASCLSRIPHLFVSAESR